MLNLRSSLVAKATRTWQLSRMGIVVAICLLDLVQALGNQEGADAVAGHESETGLEEIESTERGELVEDHQELVPTRIRAGLVQPLGQAAADLVENEPYRIARRFASLDQISGGRAGLKLVTTANPEAALKFGYESHLDHEARYVRAREFVALP